MRVTIVGEQNPYGANPRHALYPRPAGSAGARLCKVLGLGEREYVRRFRRVNLLVGDKWSSRLARKVAHEVVVNARDDEALVLLGARVSKAFGREFLVGESGWIPRARISSTLAVRQCPVRVLVVPHPSGRSRLWNKPGMAERVRAAILALEAEPAPSSGT